MGYILVVEPTGLTGGEEAREIKDTSYVHLLFSKVRKMGWGRNSDFSLDLVSWL